MSSFQSLVATIQQLEHYYLLLKVELKQVEDDLVECKLLKNQYGAELFRRSIKELTTQRNSLLENVRLKFFFFSFVLTFPRFCSDQRDTFPA